MKPPLNHLSFLAAAHATTTPQVPGFDISNWQLTFNFTAAYASGARFCIIKAYPFPSPPPPSPIYPILMHHRQQKARTTSTSPSPHTSPAPPPPVSSAAPTISPGPSPTPRRKPTFSSRTAAGGRRMASRSLGCWTWRALRVSRRAGGWGQGRWWRGLGR